VPEICRFFGIVIRMYYREHNPPHFYADYGGEQVQIDIESLKILEGQLNARAERMVREWAQLHRDELLANWNRARAAEEPQPIEPLE
jgi:hypothetical protein